MDWRYRIPNFPRKVNKTALIVHLCFCETYSAIFCAPVTLFSNVAFQWIHSAFRVFLLTIFKSLITKLLSRYFLYGFVEFVRENMKFLSRLLKSMCYLPGKPISPFRQLTVLFLEINNFYVIILSESFWFRVC